MCLICLHRRNHLTPTSRRVKFTSEIQFFRLSLCMSVRSFVGSSGTQLVTTVEFELVTNRGRRSHQSIKLQDIAPVIVCLSRQSNHKGHVKEISETYLARLI